MKDTIYTLADALTHDRNRYATTDQIIETLQRDVESHDTPKQLARDWNTNSELTARIETWISARREALGLSDGKMTKGP